MRSILARRRSDGCLVHLQMDMIEHVEVGFSDSPRTAFGCSGEKYQIDGDAQRELRKEGMIT